MAVAGYCIAVNLLKPVLGALHPRHPGIMQSAHVFTASGLAAGTISRYRLRMNGIVEEGVRCVWESLLIMLASN